MDAKLRASRRVFFPALLLLALILAKPSSANGHEIKVWTARALATVLAEIGPEFERKTGHKLIISSDLPNAFARRANQNEAFDILITSSTVLDDWIKEGRIDANTRRNISRSGIGVAVRAGARKPDISSVEAFRRTLLSAKSIAFLQVGSGLRVAALLEQFGIADAVKPKVTRPETDSVCELVAKGEIELGLVVITQIMTTPGVELVGPLPVEIQSYVSFSGGVSSKTKVSDGAKALLEFLRSPRAEAVIKAQGMELVAN